jgi:putative GTP pyrophosphokinase
MKENELHGVFDFERHRLQAIEQYQKARPLYEEFAHVVRNVLSEALRVNHIKVHSIEARAKTIESFGKKASTPSLDDPNKPKYLNPLSDITDLAGVRVITFFPRTQEQVDTVIQAEFDVIEISDKAKILIKEEKFGYASIHYLVSLTQNRTALLEYSRFKNLIAEIQVRTILQHALAEIEHDIQYESADTILATIHRRFMSLAGMLEIADREFQAIQDEDERLRRRARQSVREGKLEEVEITPDALKTYLDRRLGPDGRMTDFSYQFTASQLRKIGFTDFRQVDECISTYDDDQLSGVLWNSRQGQISRFEYQLLAGMGENYIKFHPWGVNQWFVDRNRLHIETFGKAGIKVGSYLPPARKIAEQISPSNDV